MYLYVYYQQNKTERIEKTTTTIHSTQICTITAIFYRSKLDLYLSERKRGR